MSSIVTVPHGTISLLFFLFLSVSSSTTTTPSTISPPDHAFAPDLDRPLAPSFAISGDVECAAASASTSFALRFISYGNYTALPPQGDDAAVPRLESVSFAVGNEANGVDTLCAFSLPLSGSDGGNNSSKNSSRNDNNYGGVIDDGDGDGTGAGAWQPCADRKDTDGKHRFTIATGAGFGIAGGRVAVNQTWFCHDEEGQLVAYTGVARGILDMTCTEGEISGYHLQNCTAPDTRLPVTLL